MKSMKAFENQLGARLRVLSEDAETVTYKFDGGSASCVLRGAFEDMLLANGYTEVNSMCFGCGRYKNECKGTACQVWTGCVYKEAAK